MESPHPPSRYIAPTLTRQPRIPAGQPFNFGNRYKTAFLGLLDSNLALIGLSENDPYAKEFQLKVWSLIEELGETHPEVLPADHPNRR